MDLKIKNVDPKDIYVIDKEIEQINKKNHTKISRSKFLRDLIKKYSEQEIKNKLNNDLYDELQAIKKYLITSQKLNTELLFALIANNKNSAINLAVKLGKELDNFNDKNKGE